MADVSGKGYDTGYYMKLEGMDPLEEVLGELYDIGKVKTSAMQKIVMARLNEAMEIIEEEIRARTPVASGKLYRSVTGYIEKTPTNRWPTGLSLIFGSPVPYAAAVEFGRKPGKMPPVAEIYRWIVQKGIAPATQKETRSMAWAIAKGIAAKGTHGAFMFRDGFEAAKPRIDRLLSELQLEVLEYIANYE